MFKNVTRGGQTLNHHMRMTGQTFGQLIALSVLCFILSTTGAFYHLSNKNDRGLVPKIIEVHSKNFLRKTTQEFGLDIISPQYEKMKFRGRDAWVEHLAKHPVIKIPIKNLIKAGKMSLYFSGATTISLLTLALWSFARRGKKAARDEFIRGAKICEPSELKKHLRSTGQASNFSLATVPLVKDSEIQGISIYGTTGSGKTVAYSDLFSQIRKKKQRAIVYDRKGTYVNRFYRPDKDILLNPLDKRCPGWNVWAECHSRPEFDAMAAALMPKPKGQDPFWVDVARILFAVVADKMREEGDFSTTNLLKYLLTSDLTKIQELVKDTEAEVLSSERVDKLALSVKAVLAASLRSLQYLDDGKDVFSIRKWMQESDEDSWLFITSPDEMLHETLRPLITTWFNVSSLALMSLPKSRTRRVWISLDELPTLNQLPSLANLVSLGRDYGSCVVVGVQSLSQFYKNYGQHEAQEILDGLNTQLILRTPRRFTAEVLAKELGEVEVYHSSEGVSYGASEMRNGISINRNQTIRQLVLPVEIQQLNNLEGYVSLMGNWPVTKVKIPYREYPAVAEEFEYNGFTPNEEIKKMVDSVQIMANCEMIWPESTSKIEDNEQFELVDYIDDGIESNG